MKKPSRVPYVTQWSAESARISIGAGKRGIRDLQGRTRDHTGVLWKAVRDARGKGKPMWAKVHGRRQRECMLRLLCQVCGQPASRSEAGVLWLLEDQPGWDDWPERAMTSHPPVCVACAAVAVQECPHLLDGVVALRVQVAEVCGVYGIEYRQRSDGRVAPISAEPKFVEYGDRRLRWVLAGQLVASLHQVTVVDLAEEIAAHEAATSSV